MSTKEFLKLREYQEHEINSDLQSPEVHPHGMPQRLRPHVSSWGRLLARSTRWSKGRKPRKTWAPLSWNFGRPWQKGGHRGRQQQAEIEDNAFLVVRSKYFRLSNKQKKIQILVRRLGSQCLKKCTWMKAFDSSLSIPLWIRAPHDINEAVEDSYPGQISASVHGWPRSPSGFQVYQTQSLHTVLLAAASDSVEDVSESNEAVVPPGLL